MRRTSNSCTPSGGPTGASCCPTPISTGSPTPRRTIQRSSRALELVAGRLRLTEADDLQADSADVVVATGAGPRAAARLAAAVRPGGWVYAEARGLASARWAAALRGAGLEEVDVVWLWPDAARAKEMVAALRRARRAPRARAP